MLTSSTNNNDAEPPNNETHSKAKTKTKTRNMAWTDWKCLVHVHGFTNDLLPNNAIQIFSKHGEVKLIFAFRTRTTGKNHLFVQYATQDQARAARGKYGQGWQGDPVYHKSVYPVYEIVSKRAATYRWDGVSSIVPEMLPPSTVPVALAKPHVGDQIGSNTEREREPESRAPVRGRHSSSSSAFTNGSWMANTVAEDVDRPSRLRGRQEYWGKWKNRNDRHLWMEEEYYGSGHQGEMTDVKAKHEGAPSKTAPTSKSLTSRIGHLYSDELLDEESSERTSSRSHCRHDSSQQTDVDGSKSKDHRYPRRDHYKDKERKDHHHHHRSHHHRSSRSRSPSRSYSCSGSHSHHRSRSPSTKTSRTEGPRAKDQASGLAVKRSRNQLGLERQGRSRHHHRSEKEDVDLLKAAPIAPVVVSKSPIAAPVTHSQPRPIQEMLFPYNQQKDSSNWVSRSSVEERPPLAVAKLLSKSPLAGPNSPNLELEGEATTYSAVDGTIGTMASKTPPSGPAALRVNSSTNNANVTPSTTASTISNEYFSTPKSLSSVLPSHHSAASEASNVREAGEISPLVNTGKWGKAPYAHGTPKPAISPFGPYVSQTNTAAPDNALRLDLNRRALSRSPIFPFNPRLPNVNLSGHIVDQPSPSHAKGSGAQNTNKELIAGADFSIKDGKTPASSGGGNKQTPYPSPVTSPLVESFMFPKPQGALQLAQPRNVTTSTLDAGLLASSVIQFSTPTIDANGCPTPSALAQFQAAQIARLRELYQISQAELTVERVAKRKAEDEADKERSMRRKLEDQLWEMSATVSEPTGVVDR